MSTKYSKAYFEGHMCKNTQIVTLLKVEKEMKEILD